MAAERFQTLSEQEIAACLVLLFIDFHNLKLRVFFYFHVLRARELGMLLLNLIKPSFLLIQNSGNILID